MLEEMLNEVRARQKAAQAEKTDMTRADEETESALEDFISKVRAARISDREATKLGKLGKELKDVQSDPNQAKSEEVKDSKISSKKSQAVKKDRKK